MRFFFATVILVIVSAKSFSQHSNQDILEKKISLKLNNLPISVVLGKIEEQAKISFAYNSSKLEFSKKVNIHVQDEKLDNVLKRLFEGSGVTYFVVNNQIILKEAKIIKKDNNLPPPPPPPKDPVITEPKDRSDKPKEEINTPKDKSEDEVPPDTIASLTPEKVMKKTDTLRYTTSFIHSLFNQKDSSKLDLGLYVSIEKSFYRLKYSEGSEKFQQYDFKISGERNFEYTIGIIPRYSFSGRFKFETGVLYSQKRKVNVDYFVANDTPLPFPMPGIRGKADSLEIFFESRYLEIPFLFQFHYKWSSLNLYSSAGIIFGMNFPNKTDDFYYQVYKGTSAKITLSPYSSGLSLFLSQGIQFHLDKNYTFYVEPAFKYSLSPVVKQSEFKYMLVEHFQYSFGIAGAIFYNF